jgi:hypothetical protein
MEIEAPQIINPNFKKWIVIAALLGYSGLVIYLFYFVGLAQLFSVVGKINIGIYALAITSVVISLTLHTLVLASTLKISFDQTHFQTNFYILYWVGVFVDNIMPGGWSGDLFKAYS